MFAKAPEATRSTKPESVAKEIQRKREEQEQEADNIPVLATVTQARLFVPGRTDSHIITASEPGKVAYELLRELGEYATGPDDTYYVLGGRTTGRLIGLDAVDYAARNRLVLPPASLWLSSSFTSKGMTDPFDVLIPRESRSHVGVTELLTFFGLPVINDDTDLGAVVHTMEKLVTIAGL